MFSAKVREKSTGKNGYLKWILVVIDGSSDSGGGPYSGGGGSEQLGR
jgi:hypothetical protein